jgi:sugar lactone lactonase YvrE
MSYPYGNTRDASDVTFRNDYRTRYIGYTIQEANTINAIVNVNDGSGAANEASEYTYLEIGRTMVTPEELLGATRPPAPVIPPVNYPAGADTFYSDPTLNPNTIAILPDGTIYMTDGSSTLYRLIAGAKIAVATGIPSTPPPSFEGITVANGVVYMLDSANGKVYSGTGGVFTNLGITSLSNPKKIAVYGTSIYYIENGASTIKKSSTTIGSPATIVAGSTPGFADGYPAQFDEPRSFVIDANGENLYIADTNNSLIRKMSTTTYIVSTLAGNSTAFQNPFATDNVGNRDGNGLNGQSLLYLPNDITIDPQGVLYIADTGNNSVRKLTQDGNLTTIAGRVGVPPVYDVAPIGYTNGLADGSEWNQPTGIHYTSVIPTNPSATNGGLYVLEPANRAVRIIIFPYTTTS